MKTKLKWTLLDQDDFLLGSGEMHLSIYTRMNEVTASVDWHGWDYVSYGDISMLHDIFKLWWEVNSKVIMNETTNALLHVPLVWQFPVWGRKEETEWITYTTLQTALLDVIGRVLWLGNAHVLPFKMADIWANSAIAVTKLHNFCKTSGFDKKQVKLTWETSGAQYGNGPTAQWFKDNADILKMRCRDTCDVRKDTWVDCIN